MAAISFAIICRHRLRPIYLKRRNVIKRHTIIDKCEYRLHSIIRSYGNARLIELCYIITLADWLWQRARANHPTFLPVCVRMAAHAHYSVYQSVNLDDYYM